MEGKIDGAIVIVIACIFGAVVYINTKGDARSNMMASSESQLVQANTAFAWSLYKQLARTNAGSNLFLSPFSISAALSMTLYGARGKTAKQMNETLEFKSLPDDYVHKNFTSLIDSVNKADMPYSLKTANALFARQDYKFLPEFINDVQSNYLASVTNMDFARNADGSRMYINKWVEDQTAQKIKDLLPSGSIDGDTAMVLVNAIYFKGNWAKKFDVKMTSKRPFHINKANQIEVNMMGITKKFNVSNLKDQHCRVLEMPYQDDILSMFIILPDDIDGLSAVESNLNVSVLHEITKGMRNVKIYVSLPKFRMESQFDMGNILTSLGMKDAFLEGVADFSGMDGTHLLYISKVVHKAFVDVNEEGTEAAAATGVVMTKCSGGARPMPFIVDRPFIFLIRDNRNGAILFLGKIENPPQ